MKFIGKSLFRNITIFVNRNKKWMKTVINYIFIIYILFLGVECVADSAPVYPKAVVSVGKVNEVNNIESYRYTGQIVAKARVQVVPRISGEIMEIGFEDGAIVKKGQVLYKLDSTQYEAAVKSAEAKLLEYQARLEYAKSDYNRNSLLFKKNAVSRDEMESTKSVFTAYKAAILEAEAELITAKDDFSDTMIIAPIEGSVGVTNYTVGNYITPSSGVLITIIQLRPVRVRFSISTADLLSMFGSVKELLKQGYVKLKLSDGSHYPIEGKLELSNNEANSTTDTIQVFANFPNDNYKLIVGSTVEVILFKKKANKVLAVSPSAVMHDSRGAYVYLVDKANKVKKQYVILGNSTSNYQIISSGLKLGETIIVSGTHKTIPGAVIEPVPITSEK